MNEKPNSGIIFRNDRKTGNQPDLRGRGMDGDGNPVEIAIWVKQGQKGEFWTYTIQPARTQAPTNPPDPTPSDNLPT